MIVSVREYGNAFHHTLQQSDKLCQCVSIIKQIKEKQECVCAGVPRTRWDVNFTSFLRTMVELCAIWDHYTIITNSDYFKTSQSNGKFWV